MTTRKMSKPHASQERSLDTLKKEGGEREHAGREMEGISIVEAAHPLK